MIEWRARAIRAMQSSLFIRRFASLIIFFPLFIAPAISFLPIFFLNRTTIFTVFLCDWNFSVLQTESTSFKPVIYIIPESNLKRNKNKSSCFASDAIEQVLLLFFCCSCLCLFAISTMKLCLLVIVNEWTQ